MDVNSSRNTDRGTSISGSDDVVVFLNGVFFSKGYSNNLEKRSVTGISRAARAGIIYVKQWIYLRLNTTESSMNLFFSFFT